MRSFLFRWSWQPVSGGNRNKDESLQTIQRLSPTTLEAASSPISTKSIGQQGLPANPAPESASGSDTTQAGPAGIPEAVGEYIVFLDDAPGQGGVAQRAQALMRSLEVNGEPTLVFDQLNGFALRITDQQAQRLQALGGVKSVEANAAVFLEPPIPGSATPSAALQPAAVGSTSLTSYANGTANSGETLPWGVRAVWQGNDVSARGNFASDTYAFVIDSGVLNTTGDLNLASTSSWHRSWISAESAFTDGNGHGSHVAGTIAALANGKGVVGVAPGAQVVSLKVFDSSGGGASYTSIIDAINHALAVINNNGLDKSKVVINMSLGGGFSSSLDTAVKNAASQGVRLAVAAGNDGKDADGYSPAAAGDHPNVFTISAVDSAYKMASWSNWDRLDSRDSVDDVDFAAPGVSVLSYYQNGQLAYLSGTSMAAPHVAGLLLAGGVQAGALVTPHTSGTADPFALGVSSTTDSSTPTTDPTPTYTVSSTSSIAEGQNLVIDISTTNVNQGTALYWQISGSGISTGDFVGLSALQGSISTDAAGAAKLNLSISADTTTEGNELMTFALFSDSARSVKVGDVAVTIQDTSTSPVATTNQILWGTTGNDVITGASGNDQLAGVPQSGTTTSALGRGQIDILTGGAGADLFLLADSRGTFYNDGNSRNQGTGDYALIKDFNIADGDKLQLRAGTQVLYRNVTINGVANTEIFLGNGDNKFSAADELIGRLENTSLAPGSGVFVIGSQSWTTYV